MSKQSDANPEQSPSETGQPDKSRNSSPERPKEYGGRKGPDPVRYGDWEKNGRCIDF